jgi:hypothetical protein
MLNFELRVVAEGDCELQMLNFELQVVAEGDW